MFAVSLLVSCFVGLAIGHECFRDWVYYRGSCYGFGETAVTWADAQVFCQTFGANLAEIESEEENTFLASLSRHKRSFAVWLGATDIFSEGYWSSISKRESLIGYSKWATGEPNNSGDDEDCLNLYSKVDYHWNDAPCKSTANFICETTPLPGILEYRITSSQGNVALPKA